MKRSMYAGRVRKEHVGQEITLKGWVHTSNVSLFFSKLLILVLFYHKDRGISLSLKIFLEKSFLLNSRLYKMSIQA